MENIHSTHKETPFGWFEALRQLINRGQSEPERSRTGGAEKRAGASRVIGRVDRPVPRHLAHFG